MRRIVRAGALRALQQEAREKTSGLPEERSCYYVESILLLLQFGDTARGFYDFPEMGDAEVQLFLVKINVRGSED